MKTNLLIVLCTFYVGMMIQWHAHYMKDSVSVWFDTIPFIILCGVIGFVVASYK